MNNKVKKEVLSELCVMYRNNMISYKQFLDRVKLLNRIASQMNAMGSNLNERRLVVHLYYFNTLRAPRLC